MTRQKHSANLLPAHTLLRCSLRDCTQAAIAETGGTYLCKRHLTLFSIGTEMVHEHDREQALPDPIESLEDDATIRTIERLGLENYDPETDKPKDAGKWMHEKRTREDKP